MAIFLIDGYNIIRTNPSLERIEQAEGMEAARVQLCRMCSQKAPANDRFIIFFDGDSEPMADIGSVEVRFSGLQKADAIIEEQANAAIYHGEKVFIATSDQDISVEGAAKINAYDFYEMLISRRNPFPSGEKEDHSKDSSTKAIQMMNWLVKQGHIPVNALQIPNLIKMIQYLLSGSDIKPQKLAAKIEKLLRSSCKVTPDPDPEKVIFRALKNYFQKL